MTVQGAQETVRVPVLGRPSYREDLEELIRLAMRSERLDAEASALYRKPGEARAMLKARRAREDLDHKARQLEATLCGLRDLVSLLRSRSRRG